MPDNTNNLAQFWQKLKQRKVLRVITMFAGAAYVVIELANNVVEPLNLPDWTPRLIIIIAVVGFPVVSVLSWIFDLTPEGLIKTESFITPYEKEPSEQSGKRKLKGSDVIIAILFIVVGILAFPRIFRGSANVRTMTMPVTVINELGEKETRKVFKDVYVNKLLIATFQPEGEDTVNIWLKYGLLEGIWEDLLQFPYIQIYGDRNVIHLKEQISAAKLSNCSHFLTGTYHVEDGYFKVTSKLHETINGSIVKERYYKGTDLFSLIDSISLQTCIDLGVSKNLRDIFPDLPIQEYTSQSKEAFKYYIYTKYGRELSTSASWIYARAVELDSTFALLSLYNARRTYLSRSSRISAKKHINQTMRHRQKLPEYRDIQTRILYYSIYGENDKVIELSEMQHELRPYNIELLLTLIDVYDRNHLFTKAGSAIKKLNELVPDYPEYQLILARNYLVSNRLNKGLRYIDKRIEENPENTDFLLVKGEILLHKHDLDNAEKTFKKAILLSPEDVNKWSLMLDHINYARNRTVFTDDLQKFVGTYRNEMMEFSFNWIVHYNYLFGEMTNNSKDVFIYPLSDSSVVGYYGGVSASIHMNGNSKVIKQISKYRLAFPVTYWKQDSIIIYAEELLESGRSQEALSVYQKAYTENPEHFYLSYYIRHLEFILSEEYERKESVLETYAGKYGFYKIYSKENKLFEKIGTQEFRLLPLSGDTFMDPSHYDKLTKFVRQDDQITGFKRIYSTGEEYFQEKTD